MPACRRNGFMSVTKGIDAEKYLSSTGGDSGWAERFGKSRRDIATNARMVGDGAE